jgi:hypothetical protein
MARIRTIKPELPQSETIGRLSRDARLLFVQLFTIADDAGRARAASRLLASLLYPYDEDAAGLIDGWLTELERNKAIRRYEVDGSQYLEIVKWLEHQKIDRPSASRLPAFVEGSSLPRESSRGVDADLGPVPRTLDHIPPTAAGAEAPPDARDFFEEFWKEYPARDGDNPKLPAKIKFDALVKTGVDPELMIAGAKRYAAKAREKGQAGTQYVAHALKWLSEQRWADTAAVAFINAERSADPQPADWRMAVKRWLGNESHWPRWAGNSPGSSACRCPPEILLELGVDPETGRRTALMQFVEVGTTEMLCHQQDRTTRGVRMPPVRTITVDGVEKTGAYFDRRFPVGYDEATGERIHRRKRMLHETANCGLRFI